MESKETNDLPSIAGVNVGELMFPIAEVQKTANLNSETMYAGRDSKKQVNRGKHKHSKKREQTSGCIQTIRPKQSIDRKEYFC